MLCEIYGFFNKKIVFYFIENLSLVFSNCFLKLIQSLLFVFNKVNWLILLCEVVFLNFLEFVFFCIVRSFSFFCLNILRLFTILFFNSFNIIIQMVLNWFLVPNVLICFFDFCFDIQYLLFLSFSVYKYFSFKILVWYVFFNLRAIIFNGFGNMFYDILTFFLFRLVLLRKLIVWSSLGRLYIEELLFCFYLIKHFFSYFFFKFILFLSFKKLFINFRVVFLKFFCYY